MTTGNPVMVGDPLDEEIFGILVDALEMAQHSYLECAQNIEALQPCSTYAESLRVKAERVADLLDQVPDEAALIALLRA